MWNRPALLLLCIGILACRGEKDTNPVKELLSDVQHVEGAPETAVALRFPLAEAGRSELFRLPKLTEIPWRIETGPNNIREVVGFAAGQDVVLAQTDSLGLVALDLASGRARLVDSSVATATLGPTGTVYLVRTNGSVARFERRSLTEWPDTFSVLPERIWGAFRDRLLALVRSPNGLRLDLLSAGRPPITQRVPDGAIAVSAWGDLAAVGTDSGITIIDPTAERAPEHHALGPVTALEFSPSAHRLYVATATDSLLVLERFELTVMSRLAMPATVTDLRADPMGRVLLARPAVGDSIWLVDANRWTTIGALRGSWGTDLPAVAPDGTILIRRGREVVALSLGSLTVEGTRQDRGDGAWLVADWSPRLPATEVATRAGTEPEPPTPGLTLYVQVSSTSNEVWARDLAGNLRRAGLDAQVLTPIAADEPYRVVLGPFATRGEAETIGRRLGMPYWIFTRDTTKTPT